MSHISPFVVLFRWSVCPVLVALATSVSGRVLVGGKSRVWPRLATEVVDIAGLLHVPVAENSSPIDWVRDGAVSPSGGIDPDWPAPLDPTH